MGCHHSCGGQSADRSHFAVTREKATGQTARPSHLCGAMILLGTLFFAFGCGGRPEAFQASSPAQEVRLRIAVFPVENLSGRVAPAGEIRRLLIQRLTSQGFSVLDDAALDRVITAHRIRFTAGVEKELAKAISEDAGVQAILIPSIELYDQTNPPKVAMFCRLVSTGDTPAILWIDGAGLAGDDSPGILGVGLIEDPQTLVQKAVESLARSLAQYDSETREEPKKGARKFRPKTVYRSEILDAADKYSIAVVPFFNKSGRKYAGEIIALHMIRNLMTFQNFEIVEPGIVRQELLRYRVIMSDGVSLPETETILNAVNADLVLNGEVLDYQDYLGPEGTAKVDFSVLFIERKTRKVVYSSFSQNSGNDGVYFFDWGRVNTAHAMASQMARAIGERMLTEGANPQKGKEPTGQRSAPRP
jgi:hypothetical protein